MMDSSSVTSMVIDAVVGSMAVVTYTYGNNDVVSELMDHDVAIAMREEYSASVQDVINTVSVGTMEAAAMMTQAMSYGVSSVVSYIEHRA